MHHRQWLLHTILCLLPAFKLTSRKHHVLRLLMRMHRPTAASLPLACPANPSMQVAAGVEARMEVQMRLIKPYQELL